VSSGRDWFSGMASEDWARGADTDTPTAAICSADPTTSPPTGKPHFVPRDEEAYPAVQALKDVLAPGSHLVVSHAASEGWGEQETDVAQHVYRQTSTPGGPRTRAQITRFFDGFDLVEPGLVWVSQWRPDPDLVDPFADEPQRAGILAGIGRTNH
jgi:hypothetical protein